MKQLGTKFIPPEVRREFGRPRPDALPPVQKDPAAYPSLIRKRVSPALILLFFDACVAVLGLYVGYHVKFTWAAASQPPSPFDQQYFQPYAQLMVLAPFVRLFANSMFGVYRHVGRHTYLHITSQLFKSVVFGTAALIIVSYLGLLQYSQFLEMREFSYSRLVFGVDFALNLLLLTGGHLSFHAIQTTLRRRGVSLRNTVIQGDGPAAATIAEELKSYRELGFRFVGFVDHDGDSAIGPNLGQSEDIRQLVNQHQVAELVITEPQKLSLDLLLLVQDCQLLGVTVTLVPDLHGLLYHHSVIEGLAGMPVIRVNDLMIAGYSRFIKRAEDVLLSLLLLTFLTPLFIVVAIAIRLDSPGSVFFTQKRIGRYGRHFDMYKFRSMHPDAESLRRALQVKNESNGPLFKLRKDPRVTRVGRVIRRFSIDELPQLFNVLKGDMSLVGPRPLPICDISDPNEWVQRRFAAVPGITGLWQVNRVAHTQEEMLRWDLHYIDNWSLWLDLRTIFRTVFVVLFRRGAY